MKRLRKGKLFAVSCATALALYLPVAKAQSVIQDDGDLPVPDAPAPDSPPAGGGVSGGQWHFSVSPYLWLPGMHGTIGAVGRDAFVRVSPIDLLSHFRFGLMGAAEGRWKRVVLPADLVWARLRADKTPVFPGIGATDANVKASILILSPKVGYRFVNEEKIKLDFTTGFRFWHLGQNLKFDPSILNRDFSGGQSWVDPLVGGRIETPLSSKLVFNVFGDVGGWGTGSQLEYQVGGALGLRVKENVTVQAGYRYLDVNYRGGGNRQIVFDMALSGVMLGVTFQLK